ncbi:MAG: hypothetical protein R8G34_08600 [Paracoccaceae bacterium]|nr:hypothetical protein [Paracoccaceae bacterium]
MLDHRRGEMSLQMRKLILGHPQDRIWLDRRIERGASDIHEGRETAPGCPRFMTNPRIRSLISTAMAAAMARSLAVGANLRVAQIDPATESRWRAIWGGNINLAPISAHAVCANRAGHHAAPETLATVLHWHALGTRCSASATQQVWCCTGEQAGAS